MKLSPDGVAFIQEFEGLRLDSYKDQAGIWTIGYGTTGPNIGPNQRITKDQANKFFLDDVKYFEDVVTDALKIKVNQNEFDALVSFAYNVGPTAFSTSTLLRILNNGALKTVVAAEFLKWVKVGDGKVSEGLKRRRARERELFLSKPLNAALSHSILAQQDTWLKRKPLQSSELPAEEKLFVPKGSAHVWQTITMIPGEDHYRVQLEAQPEREWWLFPPHWKIINDAKPQEITPPFVHPDKLVLSVPYYSQRDNAKDPMRTCFSSSCAMLLKYLKPSSIKGDDEYIKTVLKYGDTTSPTAQLRALEEYGLEASFHQNGGWSDIDSLLTRKIPVPIGILHKGPVSSPSGGGHWIIIIGRTEDNTSYIVHDPFGDLNLVNGGYVSSNGKSLNYSKKNLAPRWMVEGAGSGWYIKAKI
jgi:GH24 family phage-related lysozyme (muramidase)